MDILEPLDGPEDLPPGVTKKASSALPPGVTTKDAIPPGVILKKKQPQDFAALGGGSGKPAANAGGKGLPMIWKQPVQEAVASAKKLGQEFKEHPIKATGDVIVSAAGAVPRFGEKLVEAPIGLYSIADPEGGAAALENTRDFWGWTGDNFQADSQAGRAGAGAGDVGMGFLQVAALGGAPLPAAARVVTTGGVMGALGAASQANAANSVDIPGETPQQKAHRVRMGAAGRGAMDALMSTVPMSDYAKRALSPALAIPAEAAGITYANQRINQASGLPQESGGSIAQDFLTNLGMGVGAHVAGGGIKRDLAAKLENAPKTQDLGSGAPNIDINPSGRATQEVQRANYANRQARLADETALQGVYQRLNSKYSQQAGAEVADYLSHQEAGIPFPKPLTSEAQSYLGDPDFQLLQKTISQRAPNLGYEEGGQYFPRKVNAGYGEQPVSQGQRGALGRSTTEAQQARTVRAFTDSEGNRSVASVDGDKAQLWSGKQIVGEATKGPEGWVDAQGKPLKLGEATLSEAEQHTPYMYEKNPALTGANAALGAGDVARTQALKTALKTTGMLAEPSDIEGTKGTQFADWPQLGKEYGDLAGSHVHPEMKEVLDSIAQKTGDSPSNSLRNINNAVLKATFQINPAAHMKNMASHFVKSATGIAFRYPEVVPKLGELSDQALLMEKSIRENNPTPEATEYLQSGGVVMGGAGGRKYGEKLGGALDALLKRENQSDIPNPTETSDRVTWQNDDRARMMLYLMRKAGGEKPDVAVKNVNDAYPSYQAYQKPTGIGPVDTALDATVNNPMFVFQRYARGKFNALGTMAKKAVSSDPGERREAIGNGVGMGLNTALVAGGVGAAIKALSGDDRKKAALGGGEHVVSDVADVAQGKLGPLDFLMKQTQLSPAARATAAVVGATGNGYNPDDVYDAMHASGQDRSAAIKNLARQGTKNVLGAGAQGIPGVTSSGDAINPLVSLLGAKRDYTPTEKQLANFQSFQLPMDAQQQATASDRSKLKALLKQGEDIGDVVGQGNLGRKQILDTAKGVAQGSISREAQLGQAASKLPPEQIIRLLETAKRDNSQAEFDAILGASKKAVLSALHNAKGSPNKYESIRRRFVALFGDEGVKNMEQLPQDQQEEQ